MGYKIAIAGATGMVGRTILKVLEERAFPVDTLIPIASERSIGSNIEFDGQEIPVVGWEQGLAEKPDIALFSAGGSLSIEYAPKFAAKGIRVIDNSSAFRMDADKKLVVPEVNGDCLESSDKIIANPNTTSSGIGVENNEDGIALDFEKIDLLNEKSPDKRKKKKYQKANNIDKEKLQEAARKHLISPILSACGPQHCIDKIMNYWKSSF